MPMQRLSLGAVTGAHGVRGQFKVKPFTDQPKALDKYGPVWLEDGRQLSLSVKSVSPKGFVLVSAVEITSKEAADALRGCQLLIDRDKLPPSDEGEHYHADLIGLTVVTEADGALGQIIGIHDFGAGEIVEIEPEKGPSFMLPFSGDYLAKIDDEAGAVVLDPPIGMVALAREQSRPKKPGQSKSGQSKSGEKKSGKAEAKRGE